MSSAGSVYLLTALLSLGLTEEPYHREDTDTYHVSAGHLFLLRCTYPDSHSEVMWSRRVSHNGSLPNGVEIRDGLLWFLPVQMSHSGTYVCQKRDGTGQSKRTFSVLVSSGDCPAPNEDISITEGVRGGLPCKQTAIFSLKLMMNIRWMKDCHLMQLDEESAYVDESGFLRLLALSERNAGNYTCLIDIVIDGRTYTAARSIQLTFNNGSPEVFPELQVVSPQQDVFIVQVGGRAELQCLAYTGFSEDAEILMFWMVDGQYTDDHEELSESWKFIHDRGKVYGQSSLFISKVLHQFLNVPIHCCIRSPAEETFGLAWLQEADHSEFHRSLALCVTASLVILLLFGCFFFFKLDIILAYREVVKHFSKHQASDEKLYDAYVSVVQSDTLSSDGMEKFVLQILPDRLEKKHGYSLYIRGRDDRPGEAMHDVIATALHQCHRLIFILSPDGKAEETTPLCGNQKQLLFEQKLGLQHALMQNDLKVILVEVDGPVDYSHLPESLCHIKRKQGALKWKNIFVGANKLTTLYCRRNFWNNVIYHMPAVPTRRLQSVTKVSVTVA